MSGPGGAPLNFGVDARAPQYAPIDAAAGGMAWWMKWVAGAIVVAGFCFVVWRLRKRNAELLLRGKEQDDAVKQAEVERDELRSQVATLGTQVAKLNKKLSKLMGVSQKTATQTSPGCVGNNCPIIMPVKPASNGAPAFD
jgi:hypothetical protein